jgi:prolipoprotein diacylglyceryltransferase
LTWHVLFEALAYAVAFRVYVVRREQTGDFLDTHTRWMIVAAAIAGAVIGSKLLYWLEDPMRTAHEWRNFNYLLGGKTVVGALLGGTLAVEIVKRRTGVHRRTGDLFAVPLCLGIAIGRVGCFFGGLADDTYGIATSLPWGVDFGDHVRRHPVQLYESFAMIVLAILLARVAPPRFAEGDRYRLFLSAYCAWRILIDWLKPGVFFGGLTMLQWSCLGALLIYSPDLIRIARTRFNSEVSYG